MFRSGTGVMQRVIMEESFRFDNNSILVKWGVGWGTGDEFCLRKAITLEGSVLLEAWQLHHAPTLLKINK